VAIISQWLQLRRAWETGGAVKFNLFTVRCPQRLAAWLYTGLEFQMLADM